jgi:hypothetical protein
MLSSRFFIEILARPFTIKVINQIKVGYKYGPYKKPMLSIKDF